MHFAESEAARSGSRDKDTDIIMNTMKTLAKKIDSGRGENEKKRFNAAYSKALVAMEKVVRRFEEHLQGDEDKEAVLQLADSYKSEWDRNKFDHAKKSTSPHASEKLEQALTTAWMAKRMEALIRHVPKALRGENEPLEEPHI